MKNIRSEKAINEAVSASREGFYVPPGGTASSLEVVASAVSWPEWRWDL
jgi:hypothetical protein